MGVNILMQKNLETVFQNFTHNTLSYAPIKLQYWNSFKKDIVMNIPTSLFFHEVFFQLFLIHL